VPMKRFPWRTVVPVTQRLAVIVFLPILGMVSARALAGDNVWTSIGPGGTWVNDLVVDPQNPSTVYTGLSAGIFKTTDGGASWNQLTGLPAGSSPLAIDPQNPSTVYAAGHPYVWKSVDGGASWNAIWNFGSLTSNWLMTFVVDPRNPSTLYAALQQADECGGETLHKSVDGGESWVGFTFESLGAAASCVSDLVIDPQNPATLYAAFQRTGVFKSVDGGASWTAANSGLIASDNQLSSSLAIDPQDPSILYTVAAQRSVLPGENSWSVFKSNNGGANWNLASSGLPKWSANSNCCYRPRLVVDPQSPNRVYLGAAVEGVHRVFMSADGGATWMDSGFAMPSQGGWFEGLAVGAQGPPGTVYAGTQGQGVFAITFPPGRRELLLQIRYRLATRPSLGKP
jgi:photosystem II stability/assembly factor-like uncharacterized protein